MTANSINLSEVITMSRIIEINSDSIVFDTGHVLSHYHGRDCCESHYLEFDSLTLGDVAGLEFDLSGDGFFERVDGFGIRLVPTNGHPVPIPGYGYNNGYYSADIQLFLEWGSHRYEWDVSECQEMRGG